MDSGTVKLQQKCKKKGGKKAIIIIIKAVKDAVSGPFSKHLSPSLRANTLIIKGLENRSDSDRCFATFYFTRVEQNTPAKKYENANYCTTTPSATIPFPSRQPYPNIQANRARHSLYDKAVIHKFKNSKQGPQCTMHRGLSIALLQT